MGRTIRRVPARWEHPKQVNRLTGEKEFIPLMDDYLGSLKYWKEDCACYEKHITEVITGVETRIYDKPFYTPESVYEYLNEEEQMLPPDPSNYMPNGEWYQYFENVSEGTPLSPPFKTSGELVDYLVENGDFWKKTPWDRDTAEAMIEAGSVVSGVITGGKIYQNEDQLKLEKK